MASADAQKSEVHDQTADASTSPAAQGEASTTKSGAVRGSGTGAKPKDIEPSKAQTIIISDDTADGGPLIIQSQEPALNPPLPPQDPFPTNGVADVDVASEASRPAKLRSTGA